MYTTVDDLAAFWFSLLDRRLLSPDLTDTFLETRYAFDDENGYGCGLYKKRDSSSFWIVGGDAGVGFYSRHFVTEETTVSVMSNITNGESPMAKLVIEAIDGGR